MKINGRINGDLASAVTDACFVEASGCDGLSVSETAHDAFLPLVLAAEHTSRVEIWTGIAVALARNPATLAMIGHDLQSYSGGRFVMGLGSQVEAHIRRRFSMPWGKPAARMKEFIRAMHAIWDNWYDAKPLRFEGEFYAHTLMTPAFTPTDTTYGRPQVVLAAIGPKMTEAAAEVADGILCHGFTTERYLREVTIPILENALQNAGRARGEFQIAYPPLVAMGETEQELEQAKADVRKQIAFYGSTPAYRNVLDLHGWGDLQPELTRLSKLGQWDAMAGLVDDEILHTFALVGSSDVVGATIRERYADLVDVVTLTVTYADKRKMDRLIAELK